MIKKTTLCQSPPPDSQRRLDVTSFVSDIDVLRSEVFEGLAFPQKMLPCKLFYDECGSRLFDRICELPEYYPARTELQIMRDHGREMAAQIGSSPLIVEFGSGSSLKTRFLLDALPDAVGYIPIDISAAHLKNAALSLAISYPQIPVYPVCADYTRPFHLPSPHREPDRVVAYFPGSTIGNFEPDQARTFLKTIRKTCGRHSSLLIGVDLKKEPATLHAAYNDAAGVTGAFNLNLLRHINHDLGADFDIETFAHYAHFSPSAGRVEMHLVSRRRQVVKLGNGLQASFEEGESIHTESCHKFTVQGFNALATEAGYRRMALWLDPKGWFSVQYFASDE